VDVVIDFLGASSWGGNVEVLAPLGRLVLVGTMSGSRVEADLSPLMRKRLTVVGTVLRSRPIEEKIALTRAFAHTILPILAMGRIRPTVDRVLPLSEAARAHEAMERNENFGKIVLTL
jgi:NADPH:quinone reductase-like Zn-dependent oxidoreductase